MDGSGKASGGGTGAMEVSVATVLMETNDKCQDGTQLVVASELELGYDPQEGAELVVASQQEVIRDTHEGTELVVASQQELRDYAQAELVASSQKELNDKSQVGTLLVVASQQELRDDSEGEAELVAASQKEVNCVALEGAQLVGAYQQGLINETSEKTDIVVANRLEPNGNLQGKSNREGSSQQELNDNVQQGTKLACEKDVNDDYNEATEVVIAAQKDDSDHNVVGAELVAVLQNEPVNATEEGTEVSAASHRELNDDPQEGPELGASLKEVTNVDESQERPDPVEADHEAEDFEEPSPTDALAKVTSRTTDVCPSNSLIGTASEIPAELLLKDGNSTQVPVREGRKIKWKDMARRKPNSLASTEDTQAWIQPAVARKSEPRRRKSIPTNSAANLAIDAIQQIPFPHQMFPLLASASPFTQTGKEISIGVVPVDNADLPTRPLDRLVTELPAVSSGKPPRPPSSGHSVNFKCGHPSDFTNPPIVQGNGQQEPDYRKEHPHELNQASSNYVYPHGLNLPHACRQPLPSANQEFRGPSSLTVPEVDPPDDTELPSTRSKRKKSNAGQRPQQKGRNPHKRRLEQMRTQVIKKLKLWGRKSKLIQDDNGAGQSSNDRERLIMGEEQRDVLVKKMVESCRKDPQMRERFLAAVKQLANVGVLNSAAGLLVDKDSSGRSEHVINAWKEMHLESAENSSIAVNLYNAVDELHKQSEVAMLKLPCVDDSSLCSLNKTSEGPWELVFPDLGPLNRRTKRNDDRLDEPLRPSKSKNFAPD